MLLGRSARVLASCRSAPHVWRSPRKLPHCSRRRGSGLPSRSTKRGRGQLYVSNDPKHHSPGYDFQRDIDGKAVNDRRYAEASRGVMEFRKVNYRSSLGDLDIPAYLFQPLTTRGANGHAAMVWVHGGVHGNWGVNMFPFVREAVERGYVVICPEYRGSTGYGEKHHNAIDYGGYEIDDVMSAVDYLKTLPLRRSGATRHHGLEPRRLHHPLLGLP